MINNIDFEVWYREYRAEYYLQLRVRNLVYPKSKGNKHLKSMSLGFRVKPDQWNTGDNTQAWVLGNDQAALDINTRIRAVMTALENLYYRLKTEFSDREPSAVDVVNAYLQQLTAKPFERKSFLEFIKQYADDHALGDTAEVQYKNTLVGAVKGFLKEKMKRDDIYLDELDTTFMYRFEMYMNHAISKRGKPFKESSRIKMMECTVAVINYAKSQGEIKNDILAQYDRGSTLKANKKVDSYVLNNISETVFWKIAPESLHKIETIQPMGHGVRGDTATDTGNQFNYDLVRPRLIFLLQTWTGFAWKDICKHRDLRNMIINDLTGRRSLVYYRAKNGELATLPLFEQTERLLQALDYNAQPLCSYDTFNRRIKALLRYYVIETPEETVTHLGRHLFGSRMLSMGFAMESISRMMGHTSISQTEKVYARIDLTKVQADYDRVQLITQQLGTRIAI